MRKKSTYLAAVPAIGLVVFLWSVGLQVRASGHGSQVPCHAPTAQSHTSSPDPDSYVRFPTKAIDRSTLTASLLHVPADQPGSFAQQTLLFDTPGQFSDTVTLKFSFPFAISNTAQISNVSIVLTTKNMLNYINVPLSGPDIALNWTSPNTVEASHVANHRFDRIEVWLNSGNASQVDEVRIHYATKPVPAPDLLDEHLRARPGGKVTFRAVNPKGAVFKWYSQPAGGAPLHTGKTFTTPAIHNNAVFYVEAVLNGCVSPRTPAYVQVQPPHARIMEYRDRAYGGPFDDFLTAVVPVSGGFVIGGTVTDSGQDIRVMRISQAGNVIWEKRFGGSGVDQLSDIIPTADGGYLLGGSTTSSDGDITDGNNGGSDFLVIKLNSAGEIQWNKTFGGSDQDFLSGIAASPDGGYLLGGNTASSDLDVTDGNNGSFDYWVVKIDAFGNKQGDETFGGSNLDNLTSVLRASGGGYILGGYTRSSDGDVTDGNNGGSDFWLVKISFSGINQGDVTFGGSGEDISYMTVRDTDGGYLMVGVTESVDGDITDGNNGLGDGLIIKLDELGNKLWDRTLGGDNADEFHTIQPLPDGGYLFGGITYSGESGDVSDFNQGELDIWVGKLDASRDKIWDATFGGTADDQIQSIQLLPSGKYLVAGSTQSFDGDLSDEHHSEDLFLNDFWLIPIRERFGHPHRISFDDTALEAAQLAYPNPFSSYISFHADAETVSWKLYDVNGKPVPVNFTTEGTEVILNTSNLKPGVYILKTLVGEQAKVQRVIKL